MEFIFDVIINLVSLVFLSILGVITGLAIPGLFIVALAPWLDWILPVRKKDGPSGR
ncbi:MAG: hypothetical protein HY727_00885 [Candidatus Rokubacteria bacterium]|nr:hypothetical protein [Candidatus Rokubacteria bacterium]